MNKIKLIRTIYSSGVSLRITMLKHVQTPRKSSRFECSSGLSAPFENVVESEFSCKLTHGMV